MRSKFGWLVPVIVVLLVACGSSTSSAPVQQQVGQNPKVALDGQNVACNYGQAIAISVKFLKEHDADQSGLKKDWIRGIVVKTIYNGGSSSSWTGTIVLSDSSIVVLNAAAGSEKTPWNNVEEMAALVTVGDYIVFDNTDHDYTVQAPSPTSKHPELIFLGHGILTCNHS